jgi:hypothetical protein
MKPPPRLRLEPHPSRIACAAIAVGCAAMAALVALLPLEAWTTAGALLAILGVAVCGFWRCAGRGVPVLLHVGHDRRLTASTRDGRSHDGSILDASYVGARLTTIIWRPDGAARWAPARTVLILRDTLPAEDFRRLRVLLRYGRPIVEEEGAATSGREAG